MSATLPQAAKLVLKQEEFLKALAHSGHVQESCKISGLDSGTAYTLRALNKNNFGIRWKYALEEFVERLEREALRRGVDGVTKQLYYQGVRFGEQQEYSDSLLALALKANSPKYKDKVEIGNAPGETLKVEMTPTEAARTIAFSLALGLRAAQAGQVATAAPPEALAEGYGDELPEDYDGSDLA